MATITRPDSSGRTSPTSPGVLFEDASWDDYETMLRIVGNRPIRVTYDRGSMEILSPLRKHGGLSYLLGRLIDVLTEEWDIPVEAADPMTFKREDLAKGVEPDQCYYFGDHAAQVCGKDRLEMGTDPPPDLVIEADLTSSSLDRLGIYAALGIREVWRFDGQSLHFLHLQPDRSYQGCAASLHFPGLSLAMVTRSLAQAEGQDKTAWVRSFRADVRALPVPPPQHHPDA